MPPASSNNRISNYLDILSLTNIKAIEGNNGRCYVLGFSIAGEETKEVVLPADTAQLTNQGERLL